MMLLIGMAITVAFAASLATTLGWFDLEFWWELAALITIMLLGHWMEMRAIGQARGALAALAELLPDEAERIADGETETVPIAALAVGDLVLVRPGGRVPADGVIVEGEAEMDESMVTGESKPVAKGAGRPGGGRDRGHRLGDPGRGRGGRRRHRPGRDPAAGRPGAAVPLPGPGAGRPGRGCSSSTWRLAAAALTAAAWLAAGQPDEAVARTVAVLVIACPHALGLAIPLVISISTGMAARNGILVKDRLALERMRTVDIVLFDKTGTLTKGSHRVWATWPPSTATQDRLLALAAAVEADSEHPLARAIVTAAARAGPGSAGHRVPCDERARSGGDRRRGIGGGRRPGAAPGTRASSCRPIWRRRSMGWEERGAAVLYVISDGEVDRGACRWRTRSDPSPARRSTSSTGSGSGWR